MAKKIVAIVCGCAWAIAGISLLFRGSTGALTPPGLVLNGIGWSIGILSLIALAVMASIDYARRPR